MKRLAAAGLVGIGLAAAYQTSDRFGEADSYLGKAGTYLQDAVRAWTAIGDDGTPTTTPADDWLGPPPPAFSLEFYWQQAMTAHAVAVGDLNGDGRDDIIALGKAGEYQPTQLYLYFQRPDGTMPEQPVLYPVPSGQQYRLALSMSLGDLNEDGRQDVIFTNSLDGFYYFLSQPGGGFAWREDAWINAAPIMEAGLGDIDGDGHLDVLTHVSLASLSYTDYQHNPFRELIVTSFGNGAGGFDRHAAMVSEDNYSNEGLALGDLSSDGLPELVTVAWPTPLLRHNDGASGFLPPVRSDVRWYEGYSSVVIGDVTGDGLPDYTLAAAGRLVSYAQLAGGKLAAAPLLARGGTMALRSTDLNGDGRGDLLFSSLHSSQLGYALHGAYGLEYPVWVPMPGSVNGNDGLATGDLNGDGVTDAVVALGYGGLRIARGKLTRYEGPGNRPGPPGIGTATWVDPDPLVSVDQRRYAFEVEPPPIGIAENPITGYSVYSIPGGTVDLQAGTTATTHVMTGLEDNTSYTFYARAHNAAGIGPASALSPPLVIGVPPDPNAPLRLSISAPIRSEGASGLTYTLVTANLSRAAPKGGVTFRISTRDDHTVAGVDYVPLSGQQLTIPEGQLGISHPLFLKGDTDVELDEFFFVDVSDVHGATPIHASSLGVIVNDDTAEPRVYVEAATVTEGDTGRKDCLVNVRLTEAVPHDVTFAIWTDTGAGWVGPDYVGHAVSYERIPAGQTRFTLAVPVIGDSNFEPDDEFEIHVGNIVGARQAEYPNSNWCTIVNDDVEPTLSIGDISVLEGSRGNWIATLRAELTAPLPELATFSAVAIDGSARSGDDFAGRYLAGVKILPGQTGVNVQFEVFGDTRPEPTESFSVQLLDPHKVKIADGQATVTLTDEDIPNGISVDNVRIQEGAAGSQVDAVFVVRLSEPSPAPVSFDIFTASGTAVDARDYLGRKQQGGVIPAGALSTSFVVPVLGDNEVEMDERFTVNLVDVVGATISDSQGIATVVNDDVATLSVEDVSIAEGNAGKSAALFVLRLSQPMPTPVSFEVRTEMGSASTFSDYSYVTRTGTIDVGRTTVRIAVDVVGDQFVEPDETFLLGVFNVTGAVVLKGTGIATIINDDPAPATTVAAAKANRTIRLRETRRAQQSGICELDAVGERPLAQNVDGSVPTPLLTPAACTLIRGRMRAK